VEVSEMPDGKEQEKEKPDVYALDNLLCSKTSVRRFRGHLCDENNQNNGDQMAGKYG
jgi:hypothetical protein